MADTQTTAKKTTNPLMIAGIGCLIVLVVLGVVSTIVMKFFAKKIGTIMIQSAIESKTGMKTNIEDLEKGKMTITDKKTGASIDIGSNKIPDSFPKDFPIYSGMKLLSSMSGSDKAKSAGYWLTFSTPDSFDTVTTYYKSSLSKNGWKETATYSAGDTSTTTVTKGIYSGTLSITKTENAKETNIIIMLGDDTKSSNTNDATQADDQPAE